ncbi:hypothetical protein [Falsiroseomonas tokyonensis]|uniref:Uncharacterized protein n=1 Tax=Falsiroseomonas tokyonensis TaxID=430521 RepID=A0ABV7C3B9_9PROT|nr:hypothetical protein [Falsiroseomonas tokyonensis]MBU8540789.1 hypothetical protein [Falsiroseomonas tokyonensis]
MGAKVVAMTIGMPKERIAAMQDFFLQIEAACKSTAGGYYATAKAELRGAIMALEDLERLPAPPATQEPSR